MRISNPSRRGRQLAWLVRWHRRFRRSTRAALVAFGLIAVASGMIVAGMNGGGQSETSGKTRLDWFREAAPDSVGFFERLWGRRSPGTDEAALALITEEVRSQFFRGIPFGDIIHAKARKYEVDPLLIAAIVEVESGFEIEAQSARGAVGLMQLRPSTGRWMGAKNLFDPGQNIDAGARYLKYLEERFQGDLRRQLAAYNAGEGAVVRYGGVPPYPETRSYIRKVLEGYERRSFELEQFHRDSLSEAAVVN